MRLQRLFMIGLACGVVACGGSSPPPAPLTPSDPAMARFDAFSAQRAWADLTALVAIGPRVSETRGAKKARAYLLDQLSPLEIEVQEIATQVEFVRSDAVEFEIELEHVVATVPGESPQVFMLVAPYDSSNFADIAFVGANDGASGAALLLELARVFAANPLPYTTKFVFLDGEGRLGRGGPEAEAQRLLGSQSLAEKMQGDGELDEIRILVEFNRVCDADLRISRDLGSHRMYREEFWKAAARMGRSDSFDMAAGFENLQSSHVAFRDFGVRPVLAIEDSAFGGDNPPGIYADTEDDRLEHCSVDSLDTVGIVTLAALESISDRLVKIDRFARSPLSEARSLGSFPEQMHAPEAFGERAGASGSAQFAENSADASVATGRAASASGLDR